LQVEEQAVRVIQPLGVIAGLPIRLDGDPSHLAHRPEAHGGDAGLSQTQAAASSAIGAPR